MGGILAKVFTGLIAEKFRDVAYQFDWLSLLMMVATALLANIAGWMASARILDQRPIEVLRGRIKMHIV